MGYEVALKKAWDAIQGIDTQHRYIKFLNDEYEIDYSNKNIISVSCNAPAKDYYKLLILHYAAGEHRVSEVKDGKKKIRGCTKKKYYRTSTKTFFQNER